MESLTNFRYLNNTLERKEQYFDALRDYFSRLVDYAAGEAAIFTNELTHSCFVSISSLTLYSVNQFAGHFHMFS